tara:strand:+ start:626 stop:760 length:135 start_codon:yes stop_codon:yes gene_type:complete
MKLFVQQYGKKVSLLSQQTGKNGKKKISSRKTRARQNTKKNKYR